jgi:hypothetical protein
MRISIYFRRKPLLLVSIGFLFVFALTFGLIPAFSLPLREYQPEKAAFMRAGQFIEEVRGTGNQGPSVRGLAGRDPAFSTCLEGLQNSLHRNPSYSVQLIEPATGTYICPELHQFTIRLEIGESGYHIRFDEGMAIGCEVGFK